MDIKAYESAVLEDFIQTISAINDETRVKILKFIAEKWTTMCMRFRKIFQYVAI